MSTYTHKTQEDRSQSVANQVSTKPGMAYFQSVNDGPKTTAQHKHQAIVNDSAQVRQLTVMQEMANNKFQSSSGISVQPNLHPDVVMQLRGLKPGVLNVVGENHDESDVRRPKEKWFCHREANLDRYWQENEFKERNYSVLKDLFTDRRAPADPYELRLKMLKERVANASNLIVGSWHKDELPENFGFRLKQVIKEVKQLYLVSSAWANADLDSPKYLGMSAEFKNRCLSDLPIITKLWEEINKVARAIVDSKGRKKQERVRMINEAIGNYDLEYELVFKEDNQLTGNYKAVNEERSVSMHVVANARSDQNGVWKVGESHVRDMAKSDDREYNLVPKADFNKDFLAWEKRGGDREWDTPKEQSDLLPPEMMYQLGM